MAASVTYIYGVGKQHVIPGHVVAVWAGLQFDPSGAVPPVPHAVHVTRDVQMDRFIPVFVREL